MNTHGFIDSLILLKDICKGAGRAEIEELGLGDCDGVRKERDYPCSWNLKVHQILDDGW